MNQGVWPLTIHPTLPSTNTYILDEMRAERWGGSAWILAKKQSAGRGTRGKAWQSLDGNLFISAGMFLPSEAKPALLGFGASLAIRDSVQHFAPETRPLLKWPNDVRIEHAKISGILVETISKGDTLGVVVGIGVNIASAPPVQAQATCCLADFVATPPSAEVFAGVLMARFAYYKTLIDTDSNQLIAQWNAAAESLGEDVIIETPQGPLSGVYEGINADGALRLLRADGSVSLIISGQLKPKLRD